MLVELSIALVIVGLLIGGVLVGQSMTFTAETNCSSGPNYTLTNSEYICTPIIRIGAQVGSCSNLLLLKLFLTHIQYNNFYEFKIF